MTDDRLAALRRRLLDTETAPPLDALLITSDDNRRYLTGFTGSAGLALVTGGAAVLLVDSRYVEQASRQAPAFETVKFEGRAWPAVVEQAARLGIHRLGFESEHVTVAAHGRLLGAIAEAGAAVELVPVPDAVEQPRETKDPAEIEVIRRAVEIADRAFERIAAGLQPGMTEAQVAWDLEVAMRQSGAEDVSFPIIVASGPNGAMPHHRASDRQLQPGEPIVIDMGCRYRGYCSDMTRTVTVGEPDAAFWERYRTVLGAQQACEDGIRAGILGKDADALARDVIAAAGHKEHFGHGTGHGVGLAVHESPYLSPTRGEVTLRERAVVTVEPGIYLPGWGGIRIEDIVVVGETRSLVLTTAHKFPVVATSGVASSS
jgi:Xaa-Pro aminopeptidase